MQRHAAGGAASPFAGLGPEARALPESGIVEVMKHGFRRPGLIPLWAGEGDLPTPSFITDAAAAALARGETFYTYQRGIPELRAALAAYHRRQYPGRAFEADEFYLTVGGMQAIQTAVQAVTTRGDEVLLPTPAWPNFAAALAARGAVPVCVPMHFDEAGWQLDLDRMFDAAGPRTRAIFINSPANPTGWVIGADEMAAIADFARARGLWIIADEVYTRFYFGEGRAPSFWDVLEPGERLLAVNTFSKNWAMTGWRVGWLAAPPEIGQVVENLIQYNTSGVPQFHQRACVVALEEGEAFVEAQIARARAGRDIVCGALQASNRVRFAWPQGAFYVFFAIEGLEDTARLGIRLVDEANIGIAPGTAFGPGGEAFLRICFQRSADQLTEAMHRLTGWLGS